MCSCSRTRRGKVARCKGRVLMRLEHEALDSCPYNTIHYQAQEVYAKEEFGQPQLVHHGSTHALICACEHACMHTRTTHKRAHPYHACMRTPITRVSIHEEIKFTRLQSLTMIGARPDLKSENALSLSVCALSPWITHTRGRPGLQVGH